MAAGTQSADALPRIYFVRHGRSTHNESGEDRALIWDAPLHKIGVRQASLLRAALGQRAMDLCITSPLTRAIQTAMIALGRWCPCPGVGSTVSTSHGTVVVRSVLLTIRLDDSGIRFDADLEDVQQIAPDEIQRNPSDIHLGDAVQLRRPVTLERITVETGAAAVVTNFCLEVTTAHGQALRLGAADLHPSELQRSSGACAIVAKPEAAEQLNESDDLGSPATDLRKRFPAVDFGALPADGAVWWYADPLLPDSACPDLCRQCWEREDYCEPSIVFRRRIEDLVAFLRGLATSSDDGRQLPPRRSIALFAHCWVLEEIWRTCFGRKRRFDNCEVAVAEMDSSGCFREVASSLPGDVPSRKKKRRRKESTTSSS
eukprot:TRINITY_DN23896_c0_g1_i1.p1 TRINITY_DN23896_c0_g1~~TRINITY_DN23896_c0_g1_i1.p1  ORF type:complete len:373 (-),score=75.37 TRINITY_DN23896_c0_g1_i1:453-1571(-)